MTELTEGQKEKLKEWWEPKVWDICAIFGRNGEFIWKKSLGGDLLNKHNLTKDTVLPLLSIGQMIELLAERDPSSWGIECSKCGGWYITSCNLYGPKYYVSNHGKDFVELADALFQAMKEAL